MSIDEYLDTVPITDRDLVVGDEYGGGTICYLDGNGGGLVAQFLPTSNSVPWGSSGNAIGTTSIEIDTGYSNTTSIVNELGEGDYAAIFCYKLEIDDYDDWYLPSNNELELIYSNLEKISSSLYGRYWSSTEYSSELAWSYDFNIEPNLYLTDKSQSLKILPIRNLAPAIPEVSIATETDNPIPIWIWNKPDGTVSFKYRLDSDSFWIESFDTSYEAENALPVGTYNLLVKAVDSFGNWSRTGSCSITIDRTPFVTGLTQTNNNKPTWSWLVPAGSKDFRYSFTDGAEWVITNKPSFTPVNPLDDGYYTLFVQVSDSSGNWSESGFFEIEIDTIAPISPTITGEVNTNNPRPIWTWNNPLDAVEYRYSYSDGTEWTYTNNNSFTPIDNISDGFHTLYVQARDSLGNWSDSGNWTIEVDAPPPAPVFTGDTVTNKSMPSWIWSKPLDAVEFRYSFTDGSEWIATFENEFNSLTTFPDGMVTLYVQARDNSGNWSESGAFSIEIDTNAPPAPNLSDSFITMDTTPTWTWASNADSIEYRYSHIDGTDWSYTELNTYTPISPLTTGEIELYVQARDFAGNWSESDMSRIYIYKESKLLASDSEQLDYLGCSVSISSDGNTIVSGAKGDEDSTGALYVFKKIGENWTEDKITRIDGKEDEFLGNSVSISSNGNTIITSTPYTQNSGTGSGSLYVFKWDGNSWIETELFASDGSSLDWLGCSVAISADGDTIASGARWDQDNGVRSGSAYIFKWDGFSWIETKITASDGKPEDGFGDSISISADGLTISVGDYRGNLHVYKWNGIDWDETLLTGGRHSYSHAISEDGNMIAMSSLFVFTYNGISWEKLDLTDYIEIENYLFSVSVSISSDNNSIVIGDHKNGSDYGIVHIFKRYDDSWVYFDLTASDEEIDDIFACAVDMSSDGRTIVSGSFRDDDGIGSDTGSVYVYDF